MLYLSILFLTLQKSEANNYTALLITFPLLTLVTTSQNSFSKKIRNTELKLDYTSILCNLFLMLKEKKKNMQHLMFYTLACTRYCTCTASGQSMCLCTSDMSML